MKKKQTSKINRWPFLPAALIVGAGSLLIGGAQANTVEPINAEEHAKLYPSTTEYLITRNGKTVGNHTVSFNNADDQLVVSVESNLKVTVLKVPVFRFNYTATEIWDDEKLVSVEAKTNRGGDITEAELQDPAAAGVHQSSNHWNPAVLNSNTVFNTLTGKVSDITVTEIGSDAVTLGDQTVEATRYRYDGGFKADVWYDSKLRWVQLQFKGDDGSQVTYTAKPLVLEP